jgi:hypothetical protein
MSKFDGVYKDMKCRLLIGLSSGQQPDCLSGLQYLYLERTFSTILLIHEYGFSSKCSNQCRVGVYQ